MKGISNVKYKAIGFDWSGVLFNYAANYGDIISQLFGIPEEQFLPVYYQYNHLLNVDGTDRRVVWKNIFTHFGKASEVDTFLTYLNRLPAGHLNEAVVSFARELRIRGYKIALLSNHTREGAIEARTHLPVGLFDVVLFSAEIGYMKPQKEAFLLLAEHLGVDIGELIFIDDREKSLENAQSIGYTSVLFRDILTLRETVEAILSNRTG